MRPFLFFTVILHYCLFCLQITCEPQFWGLWTAVWKPLVSDIESCLQSDNFSNLSVFAFVYCFSICKKILFFTTFAPSILLRIFCYLLVQIHSISDKAHFPSIHFLAFQDFQEVFPIITVRSSLHYCLLPKYQQYSKWSRVMLGLIIGVEYVQLNRPLLSVLWM